MPYLHKTASLYFSKSELIQIPIQRFAVLPKSANRQPMTYANTDFNITAIADLAIWQFGNLGKYRFASAANTQAGTAPTAQTSVFQNTDRRFCV